MQKTPDEHKRMRGTDQKCRMSPTIVEFPKETKPLPAPEWLKHEQSILEWGRLVRLLQLAKILTKADLTALAHYCDLHGDIIDRRQRRADVPMSMYSQLRGFQADFALNPKSRIAPGAGPGKSNRFHGRGQKGV